MSWVQAVREFANESGKWSVPKKGTDEYEKVRAIQKKLMEGVASSDTKVKPNVLKNKAVETPKKAKKEEVKAEPLPPVVEEKKSKKEKKVVVAEAPSVPAPSVAPTPEPEKPKKKSKAEKLPVAPKVEAIVKKVKERKEKKAVAGVSIEQKPVVLTF